MSAEGKFSIFCLEAYKLDKALSGKETIDLFSKYGVLEYIIDCYEALHTVGFNYIIGDIDEFIAVRK